MTIKQEAWGTMDGGHLEEVFLYQSAAEFHASFSNDRRVVRITLTIHDDLSRLTNSK